MSEPPSDVGGALFTVTIECGQDAGPLVLDPLVDSDGCDLVFAEIGQGDGGG